MTNEAGEVVYEADYLEFGEMFGVTGTITETHGFTGKEWDEDLQLYYYNARWYEPQTGRFISKDPISSGINWYIYASNNPLAFLDPDGLEILPITDFGYQDSAINIGGQMGEKMITLWDSKYKIWRRSTLGNYGCLFTATANIVNTIRGYGPPEIIASDYSSDPRYVHQHPSPIKIEVPTNISPYLAFILPDTDKITISIADYFIGSAPHELEAFIFNNTGVEFDVALITNAETAKKTLDDWSKYIGFGAYIIADVNGHKFNVTGLEEDANGEIILVKHDPLTNRKQTVYKLSQLTGLYVIENKKQQQGRLAFEKALNQFKAGEIDLSNLMKVCSDYDIDIPVLSGTPSIPNNQTETPTTDNSEGGGGSIICTELYRQGLMNEDIYIADEDFGAYLAENEPEILYGYRFLARPAVALMKKSKTFTHIVNIFAKPWSYEMAYIMGEREQGDILGKLIMLYGLPLCKITGIIITNQTVQVVLLIILLLNTLLVLAIIKRKLKAKGGSKQMSLKYISCGVMILCLFLTGCVPSSEDLYKAIDENDLQKVKELIASGVDVNKSVEGKKVPLAYAVENDKLDIVKELIKNGADFNIKVDYVSPYTGKTYNDYLLLWVLIYKNEELLNLLLANNLDINFMDDKKNTLLHYATSLLPKEYIKLLVERGANMELKNKDNRSVLDYAIFHGETEKAKLLIELGADVNTRGYDNCDLWTELAYYWQDGYLDLAAFLWEKGLRFDFEDFYGLHATSIEGNYKYMKWLLDHGADPNKIDEWGKRPIEVILMTYDSVAAEGELPQEIQDKADRIWHLLREYGSEAARSDF